MQKTGAAITPTPGAPVAFEREYDDVLPNVNFTWRFAPNQQSIVYMSYVGRIPSIYVYEIGSGRQRLVVQNVATTFAPRFSPDGRRLVMSVQQGGNADIVSMDLASKAQRSITNGMAIDTSPTYSPDGAQIAFESDRGGSQQVYSTSS